jgi:alpha-L-fucosidase
MKKSPLLPFTSSLLLLLFSIPSLYSETQVEHFAALTDAANKANLQQEPVAHGEFQPTWESLEKNYHFPEWFRDAKFGLWAHWGPQCAAEHGDWYARNMYAQHDKKGGANAVYQYHVDHYGHPSVFGFKDVIPTWKAERWDPKELLTFYKKCGARYFMALANHHDNLDTWDSKYQPWNSVNLGPHKDLIAGWAEAAKEAGLHFGVSVHAARAWGWNSGTTNCDTGGPKTGVPYDGVQTTADGKGKWWEGLNPQDLYAQNHGPKDKPSAEYMNKFYNRTMDLVNRYHPEMLYFDDDISRGLPLYGDDPTVGLRIAAHYYNSNMALHDGTLTAVIAAKKLADDRKTCLLYDIERGGAETILPQPWQTDTCIGSWHYDKGTGERNGYKKPRDIIPLLADIVSKNGNLMLSVPVRSDGTIDDNERKIVQEIGDWLSVNGEAIYATRPWKLFGEGPPRQDTAVALPTGEVKEKKVRPLDASDIRFTTSKDGKWLYAIVCGVPQKKTLIKALAANYSKVSSVDLIGSTEKLKWTQSPEGLVIQPVSKWPTPNAVAFKIGLN